MWFIFIERASPLSVNYRPKLLIKRWKRYLSVLFDGLACSPGHSFATRIERGFRSSFLFLSFNSSSPSLFSVVKFNSRRTRRPLRWWRLVVKRREHVEVGRIVEWIPEWWALSLFPSDIWFITHRRVWSWQRIRLISGFNRAPIDKAIVSWSSHFR